MNGAKINSSFWRGKRVFVTGHTGFKGSWLSFWLHELGAVVTGYSLPPPTDPSLFGTINLGKKISSLEGDLREYEKLREAIKRANPQIVFHLAAQALVLPSYEDPLTTFSTNVLGTANLLNACRDRQELKTIINITTDKVYENREWSWPYRENDRIGGHDPYSASKACAELVSRSFALSFFEERATSLINCRAGNVFGGGDWGVHRIVPDAMRAFAERRDLIVRNSSSVRPWQHVLEPLRAYLLIAEKSYQFQKDFPRAWNIGPRQSDAISVQDLAEELARQWGSSAQIEMAAQPIQHEAQYLKLDCSLAEQVLNWLPLIELRKAISMTVYWYKSYYDKNGDLENIMREQIKVGGEQC